MSDEHPRNRPRPVERVTSLARSVKQRLDSYQQRREKPGELATDVLDLGDTYLVLVDAPGVRAGDIQVRYVEGQAHVRMERFRPPRDEFELVESSRQLGLEATAELPEDAVVSAEQATATLTSTGVLEIRLPKTAPDEEASTEVTPVDVDPNQ